MSKMEFKKLMLDNKDILDLLLEEREAERKVNQPPQAGTSSQSEARGEGNPNQPRNNSERNIEDQEQSRSGEKRFRSDHIEQRSGYLKEGKDIAFTLRSPLDTTIYTQAVAKLDSSGDSGSDLSIGNENLAALNLSDESDNVNDDTNLSVILDRRLSAER